MKREALCDSCGKTIAVETHATCLTLADRTVLEFDLCQVCQLGLLGLVNDLLVCHPARLAA